MQHRTELSDETPIADAVEQDRTAVDLRPDDDTVADPPAEVPLEAAPADWQEQREIVDIDPEEDMTRD